MILSGAAAEPGEPASKAMLQKEGGGMFNTDLAEGGKLAVLRKDNSILTGAVAACQRTPGSTVAFSKI